MSNMCSGLECLRTPVLPRFSHMPSLSCRQDPSEAMNKAAVFCFTSNEKGSYSCAIHRAGFLFSMVWHVSDLRLPCCLDLDTDTPMALLWFSPCTKDFYFYIRGILTLYLLTPAYICTVYSVHIYTFPASACRRLAALNYRSDPSGAKWGV